MEDQGATRAPIDLSGVPETMLWPLWNRAAETRRRNGLLHDPMALALVEAIDYDFEGHFGRPSVLHAIRARVSDDLVREHLATGAEDPVVVSLGEGLETQIWRVDPSRGRWLGVDLPEAIQLRRRLLPRHPRATLIEGSALDPSWMEAVPGDTPPLIIAAGLLMYFREEEVRELLARVAARFPGGALFFDTITPHLSQRTQGGLRVTRRYTAPAMPWGITLDDLPRFLASIPGLGSASVQSYFDPFPGRTGVYRALSRFEPLRRRFAGGLVHVQLGASRRGGEAKGL